MSRMSVGNYVKVRTRKKVWCLVNTILNPNFNILNNKHFIGTTFGSIKAGLHNAYFDLDCLDFQSLRVDKYFCQSNWLTC